DPGFRLPQVWRSDLAVDRRLPWGVTGTLEGLFTRDVNGIRYINANLPAAQARLSGADDRPRWTANRIHSQVTSAVVLDNQGEGYGWNVAASLSKTYGAGFLRAAYAYGQSRSPAEPGALAPSWVTSPHSGDPNDPGVQRFAHGHRAFLAGSHRFEYLEVGATTLSFFLEGRNAGNASYTYAGDLNGDGGTANDLVYVPRDASETSFQAFTSGGRTYTAAEQAAAWDAYISQDAYLRERRGSYAERNGILLPMLWRLDVSIAQELFASRGGRRHALQVRADVLNVTNLLDDDWGVAPRLVSPQPLTNAGVDAQGRATYRLRVVNGQLLARSFQPSATILDVYRAQLTVKYSFD
ncbi:MAG TPA: TonB-dependent receptor, partial [Vicinamibacteria bacterium]